MSGVFKSRNQDRIEALRLGRKHGQDRALSYLYTIDQLIMEYHILRQVICDVMQTEKELTSAERELITSSIEQAVNDAATEYSEIISKATPIATEKEEFRKNIEKKDEYQ